MGAPRRFALTLALFAATGACSGPEGATADKRDAGHDEGVTALLRGVAGLQIVADEEALEGQARFYRLTFAQPVDHTRPGEGQFQQRVTLLHRRRDAPTVLYASGYYVGQAAREAELTNLLQANQVSIEHRFFPPSRPEPPPWQALTIEQAAADHHRLVEALRPILTGKWISSGGSKGGLASLFHRRFYPADVAATVAYVAPLLTDVADPRFPAFFDRIGGDACRARLRAFQRASLRRRDEIAVEMAAWATSNGHSFARLGQDRALEFAVLELPFFVWQYHGASTCDGVPADDAPAAKMFEFLDGVVNVADNWVDANVEAYAAYWYQSATELGAPLFPEAHLDGLLRFRGQDTPATFAPPGSNPVYRPEAARDVARWVASEAEGLLLLYGENDPWSAAAVDLGGAKDALRLTVAAGNHTAKLGDLGDADRTAAYRALERWSGRAVQGAQAHALVLLPLVQLHRDGGAEAWHLRER